MNPSNTILTLDLNAAFDPIAARLKDVDGIRAVHGINALSRAIEGNRTGTDGYAYLIYVGEKPAGSANRGQQQKITVSYDVVIATQTYDDRPSDFGKIKARIIAALNGFSPLDPDPRSQQRLRLVHSVERDYFRYGFSLHPLRFEIDFIIQGAQS